ncbi:5-methyltetrahydropteroyltriglutamate--homocysteine S-methyltransferase [Clostridium oryzae]|uniref:5-methyltetrahydropteroyltriglutamate--homocysteine methyltransferase n=1 Tax=Clostridium oryzae TaxID=1450648 RepID=A0A1V4IJD5_9CLOT|nr:5-methyltetrahydropteroyltriglutamate--homocysteine S-methyltransferase [Clostridium oryzae]OPJ60046.1 5-methyltetrahydropteroyltriglutamate--homocysteine methyltransferase [Clostridium oryzae]
MNTKIKNAPFKYDIVGSFLRPEKLKDARRKFDAKEISANDLTQIEDECIKDLIKKQKSLGLNVITDGEFRRSWWHLDFMWGLNGINKVTVNKGYIFNDEETRAESAAVTGKITGKSHPFVEHFKYVKSFETDGVIARQTIPAPAQLLAELQRNTGKEPTSFYYPDETELIIDIAAAYHTVIMDLYNAGCRNVQLDDCTWGMFCDKKYWEARQKSNIDIRHITEQYIKVNNLAINDLPKDLAVTTHVCRGNYHSTWASQGGYEPIAEELFAKQNVDAYYLEFDDERSGGFEPLKHVSPNKQVVLGLITTKCPKLEDKGYIKSRVLEASKYVPLERLCLSPQCGFASTEEGNILTEEEQWSKIKLVKEIAAQIW